MSAVVALIAPPRPNTSKRLTRKARAEIIRRCRDGETYMGLAAEFGVSKSTVRHHAKKANLPPRALGRPRSAAVAPIYPHWSTKVDLGDMFICAGFVALVGGAAYIFAVVS